MNTATIRKGIDILVAIIFIWFAYLQLDDGDAWFWILIYGFVVIMAVLDFLGSLSKRRSLKTLIVFGILLIVYFSHLLDWIKAGYPNIVDYTEETVSVVEGVREYFGLLISFAVVSVYYLFPAAALKSK